MAMNGSEHIRDAWLLGCLAALVGFNYPFVGIFNRLTPLGGVPLSLLWLLGGWLLLILWIYLLVRHIKRTTLEEEDDEPGGDEP